MLRDLVFRLRAIFRRKAVEEELDEELRFHLENETAKRVRLGAEECEAERRARLALGGLGSVKEECRDSRGVSAIETTVRDLRYAMRGMAHNPGFAAAAVVTLGLGAAAVSTVFTLTNTLFFRKLPVERAEQIVMVEATRDHGRRPGWVSYPDYVFFRDHLRSVENLAAHYSTAPLFVTVGNRSQEVNGAVVSANFLPMLGVRPELGRWFRADEDAVPDRNAVAVISDRFWREWFGGSAGALGATMRINGTTFTVVGVVPERFRGVTIYPDEIYIPTMMLRAGMRWCPDALASDCTTLDMMGRLREGQSVEQAGAEAATVMPQSWLTPKDSHDNSGVRAVLARGISDLNTSRSARIRFTELLGAVAGVLLLVCSVNLAGLLIARNSARVREFAIRASLGAGGGRVIRQLVTESLLVAVLGGVLGIALSVGLTAALNASFYSADSEGHPLYYDFTLDPAVMLTVVAVTIPAGVLAGILPALKSIRAGAGESLLGQSSPASGRSPLGKWLAGAQAGIAMALAAVAGLLATSAQAMITGTNFDASHVAMMRLRPRLLQYSPERAQRFVREAVARIEAFPGVEAASMVGTGAPILGFDARVSLREWPSTKSMECGYIEIGPRYFETLRTSVERGREFDVHDDSGSAAVAIVSESLARKLWPTSDALGETLVVNQTPRAVVGVVADIPMQRRGEPLRPYVYAPYWQNAGQVDARVIVRVAGNPSTMLPPLVREVNRVDPDVPIAETMTMPAELAGGIIEERFTAGFASFAAVLAIVLSAVGLYGALAFAVSRRTKEIGIRMAVGAEAGAVKRMVMRDGMAVVLIGVAVGTGLGIGGASIVRHLLYGAGTGDITVYLAAALVVGAAGLVACWIPARRAASVAPLTALREQ